MFAVTIDLDAYDTLPPRQLKAMLRALRFADADGVVHATLSMLAMPGLSRSSAHRELVGLEDAGHIARQQRPEGGFLWRIGRRFRCREIKPRSAFNCRPSSWDPDRGESNADRGYLSPVDRSTPPDGTPVPAAETPVPQRGTTDSRATPAVKNLSSGSKEPSEREQLSQQDEIPQGWEAAAAAERRLAGLGPVNLACEWRKLVAYSEGARITLWRWRGWALKARGERAADQFDIVKLKATTAVDQESNAHLIGDDRQQRQARDWVRSGFWLRGGMWGPAPDQPGCTLPAALIAWCLRERKSSSVAA